MVDKLLLISETLLQFSFAEVITRYIFFEKPMPEKKQYIYYNICYVVLLATVLFFNDTVANFLVVILTGLNISLGRTTHKFGGFFLALPILGIMDGLIMPFLGVPMNLLELNAKQTIIYKFVFYVILFTALVLLAVNKKKIDKSIKIDFENRKVRSWEKTLLISIGLFLESVTSLFYTPLDELLEEGDFDIYEFFAPMAIVLLAISAFFMTVTIITITIAGNKQSYYHHKVNDMQFNIIVMMADLVENRDSNTGGHIRRTAKYVEIIARRLKSLGMFPEQLTDNYIEDMRVAAPLHDIGKINVADRILNKPDRLTDEEFAIMKSHAAAGKEIISHAKIHLGDFSYLDVAEEMAGSHHEWWDGSSKGYPAGLSGTDIPLCARIMAVADVFDALTSKRCYKEPMPPEKAYKIIKEESGTHFDPDVVDAFFYSRREIDSALKQFLSESSEGCLPQ